MRIVGYEAANSFVKSKSGAKEIVYLNTIKERGKREETVDGRAAEGRYSVEGYTYSVGDPEALSSSHRGVERYKTAQYRLESLIAISQHVDRDGEEVHVVTGVPSDHYKAPNVEYDIKNNLEGAHVVNGVEFTVNKVTVTLQPIGTLTYLTYNEDGSFKEDGRKLKEAKKLIIDVGWGTTDVAEVNGRTLEGRKALRYAMLNVYARVEEELRNKHTALYAGDFGTFELEKYLRKGDEFNYGNVLYDVKDIKEESLALTAERIMSRVGNLGFTLDKYDAVIFTGGGVDALAPYLKQYVEGVPNAIRVKNPQLANVRGYYTIGKNA